MAGEMVETMGERFKRLQERSAEIVGRMLSGEVDKPSVDEVVAASDELGQMVFGSLAFAEYVLGLERGDGLPIVDDTQVGWTIDAALADGSYRLRSPVGHVQRCQFVGSELTAKLHSQLTAAQSERDEARREVERLRARLNELEGR